MPRILMTRAPLRLPLGGGGTDLPWYYQEHGGHLVAAALNLYVYITLNQRWDHRIMVKYGREAEVADSVDEIRHDRFRECMKWAGVTAGVEMNVISDAPGNSGLGSSGAFTVALLLLLRTFKHGVPNITPKELAEEAFRIETEVVGDTAGKQDQYMAAFGGVTALNFDRRGGVGVERLAVKPHAVAELEAHLMLFGTNITRRAGDVLKDHATQFKNGNGSKHAAMHRIAAIGREIRQALEVGEPRRVGELMHAHWEAKKESSSLVSGSEIDHWYEAARANGAIGGKILGAGGGGFFAFYCDHERQTELRRAMAAVGLQEIPFRFEWQGAKVVFDL
jgi:D-glycero-alpha-D-manno-heptose-7-phosphate kinase